MWELPGRGQVKAGPSGIKVHFQPVQPLSGRRGHSIAHRASFWLALAGQCWTISSFSLAPTTGYPTSSADIQFMVALKLRKLSQSHDAPYASMAELPCSVVKPLTLENSCERRDC